MSLAERIQTARLARGWSRFDLAREINTREQNVYQWERNSRIPTLDMLERLAKAFDVTLDELVHGVPDEVGATTT